MRYIIVNLIKLGKTGFLNFAWKIEQLDEYNILRADRNLSILHLQKKNASSLSSCEVMAFFSIFVVLP